MLGGAAEDILAIITNGILTGVNNSMLAGVTDALIAGVTYVLLASGVDGILACVTDVKYCMFNFVHNEFMDVLNLFTVF